MSTRKRCVTLTGDSVFTIQSTYKELKMNEGKIAPELWHAITKIMDEIKGVLFESGRLKWKCPYLPQVIGFLTWSLALIIFFLLLGTIGIVDICYWNFRGTLVRAWNHFKDPSSDPFSRGPYALVAGIYLLLILPCLLILLPCDLLAFLAKRMSWFGYLLYVALLASLGVFIYQYDFIVSFWLKLFV